MNLLSSSRQTCPINGDQAGSISEGKKGMAQWMITKAKLFFLLNKWLIDFYSYHPLVYHHFFAMKNNGRKREINEIFLRINSNAHTKKKFYLYLLSQ